MAKKQATIEEIRSNLTQVKSDIRSAEITKANAEGSLKTIHENLLTKFNVSTLEAANILHDTFCKEADLLEEKASKLHSQLQVIKTKNE